MRRTEELVIRIFRIVQLILRHEIRTSLAVQAVLQHGSGVVDDQDEVRGDGVLGDGAGREGFQPEDVFAILVGRGILQIFVQADMLGGIFLVLFGVGIGLGVGSRGQQEGGRERHQDAVYVFHYLSCFTCSSENRYSFGRPVTPWASQACFQDLPSGTSMACTGISITSSTSVKA